MGDVGLEIVKAVIGILAPVLSILLIALVKKALDKMGLERSAALNSLVEKHVADAVEYVERYANVLVDQKISSSSKASMATKTVMDELKKAGVTNVAEDFIRRRIEAYLEIKHPSTRPPELETPKV